MSAMADRIEAYVKAKKGSVTFAELVQDIDGFSLKFPSADGLPQEGCALYLAPGILLWPMMTEEGSAAIVELRQSGRLHCRPTSFICYLTDGLCLRLPLAQGRTSYKRDHWLPVTLWPGPHPDQAKHDKWREARRTKAAA